MTFDEYQRAARRTMNFTLSERDRLLDAAVGLAEEAGEALGLVRKSLLQGRPMDESRLREELGDALWCLAILAHTAGFQLDTVAEANIDKLRRRYPEARETVE